MPLTEIPTHKQWTTLRDKAGGKANLVGSVNMGKLLDAYHDAGAKAGSTNVTVMSLAQVKYLTPLANGVKKYRAAVAKSHPKVAALCDEMTVVIDKKAKMMSELASPVTKLRPYLDKTIQDAGQVQTSGNPEAYQKLWSGPVRGIGTVLGSIGKTDPTLNKIHGVWDKYTKQGWSDVGVAPKALPADQRAARIKAAAKQLAQTATDIRVELLKLKVIN